MKTLSLRKRVLVCTNAREATNPLGRGCGADGVRVHDAVLAEIGRRNAYSTVWLTKTGCLGRCPRVGCTVVLTPSGVTHDEVTEADAALLVTQVLDGVG